jgi:hypothetical protein
VGGALGFVYAPCAGPILTAVITVGAATSRTVPVGLGFALGSALVLLLLAFGGRAVAERLRAAGRGPGLQRVLGAVLVVTAVAMATNLDVRLKSAIAGHLPAGIVDPARGLETSGAVAARLRDLRPPSRFAIAAAHARPPGADRALPRLGSAPEFTGIERWFQHAGRATADARRAARPRRARRLLDLDLHQLHPHAALPARVGHSLPPRRPRHRRGALA